MGLGCLGVWLVGQGEVVYDNTFGYQTGQVSFLGEFGDEVRMTRAVTNLTGFAFDYAGAFDFTARETVQVRIYANDGPNVSTTGSTILAPGTKFYDSGLLPIYPGLNAISLTGLNLNLPAGFTWTVEFGGLLQTEDNSASLVAFTPPTLGSSYDDFWRKGSTGWALYRFGGSPVANFGARAEVADPPVTFAAVKLADGSVRVDLAGPVGRDVLVEGTTNSLVWSALSTNRLVSGSASYTVRSPATNLNFRVSLVPLLLQITSVTRSALGQNVVTFEGESGVSFQIDRSFDGVLWTLWHEGFASHGKMSYTDEATVPATARYRVKALDTPPILASVGSYVGTGAFRIDAVGSAGQPFLVEASGDLVRWTPVFTNVFSFTTGQMTYIDTNVVSNPRRFYRVRGSSGP